MIGRRADWKLRRWINYLPFKFLGEYRILPFFFIAGALMEYSMIHWHVGEVNFYKVYKKRRIEEAVQERLYQMRREKANA